MLHLKISKELINDAFVTGTIHKFKVQQGMPKGCDLKILRFDGEIVHLYFAEPPEDVKEIECTMERVE